MKFSIICTVPLDSFHKAREILNSVSDVTYLNYPAYDEVYKIIEKFDGIFPNAKMPIDKKLLQKAKRLKVITMPAMGIDHIDSDYCKNNNIQLFSLSDSKEFMSGIPSTAEYTIGLILTLLKKYRSSMNSVIHNNEWNTSKFRGFNLMDKKVGVVGYGIVGKRVAKLARAFGSDVFFYDLYEQRSDETAKYASFDTILSQMDIITVHVPLNEKTKKMFSKKEFSKMNNTYFINASRGGVIDENDLVWGLKNKKIRSAALDVLEDESDLDFSLNPIINYARSNDNLLITPHCAGSSIDGLKKIFEHTATKLLQELKRV